MSETIKTLQEMEKKPFKVDRNSVNYYQKNIPPSNVAVGKAIDAYNWLERKKVWSLFSYAIKQYLRESGHNLPYYVDRSTGKLIDPIVKPPSLRFEEKRMHPEYKTINGKRVLGVDGMRVNDRGDVKVNPDLWTREQDDFTALVGNEWGHMIVKEYTGEPVGNHLDKGYEPLIQYALANALLAIGEIKKGEKALQVTHYT